MNLDLSADEVLTTTRAVRKRLDFDRPVERAVLLECVEIALQAPTGSNRQGWHFLFVEDAAKKQALEDLYGRAFDPYVNSPGVEYPEGDTRRERQDRVRASAIYLREHLHDCPVLLIPIHEGRIPADRAPVFAQASYWGSLLPAVWSFMLAARNRGLGSAWTTLHLPFEQEAAELLGVPFDTHVQGGLMPVAYTKGTDFKPAKREPAGAVVHWDTW